VKNRRFNTSKSLSYGSSLATQKTEVQAATPTPVIVRSTIQKNTTVNKWAQEDKKSDEKPPAFKQLKTKTKVLQCDTSNNESDPEKLILPNIQNGLLSLQNFMDLN
jgi:hypothetical protein